MIFLVLCSACPGLKDRLQIKSQLNTRAHSSDLNHNSQISYGGNFLTLSSFYMRECYHFYSTFPVIFLHEKVVRQRNRNTTATCSEIFKSNLPSSGQPGLAVSSWPPSILNIHSLLKSLARSLLAEDSQIIITKHYCE